jgi:hypothetical protein
MLNSAPSESRTRLLHRALLLGLCVVAGCGVGFVGQYLSGSSAWFLAVPGFVIVAWLFVANPDECLPRDKK